MRLAQTTQSSVKDITDLVDNAYDKINKATETARQSQEIFKDLKAKIDETANIMKGISSAAVEQQSGVEQLIGPFQKWTVLLSLIIHW